MGIYFLLHDARRFEGQIAPALANSRREHSFLPCRGLCAALAPEAVAFHERYYAGSEEPLLCRVAHGLPFDRHLWRLLVGEILLYAAAEVPELQTAPDTLRRLLAPERPRDEFASRAQSPPVDQVHFGARDLTFGPAFYQPESTGVNDVADVERLAAYLAAVDPSRWSAAGLDGVPGLESAEDREEELEFARDWFPPLRDVYRNAQLRGQLIVCERADASRL